MSVSRRVWPDPACVARCSGRLTWWMPRGASAIGPPAPASSHDETRLFHVALTRARPGGGHRGPVLRPNSLLISICVSAFPEVSHAFRRGWTHPRPWGNCVQPGGRRPAKQPGPAPATLSCGLAFPVLTWRTGGRWSRSATQGTTHPGREVRISPSRLDRFAGVSTPVVPPAQGPGPGDGRQPGRFVVHEIAHTRRYDRPAHAAEVQSQSPWSSGQLAFSRKSPPRRWRQTGHWLAILRNHGHRDGRCGHPRST